MPRTKSPKPVEQEPEEVTAAKELPEVTILVCTYDRLALLERVLESLALYLSYPPEKLKWLICDDSSPAPYSGKVKRLSIFKDRDMQIVSTEQNGGWAANVNSGYRNVATDYVFFIEDDYVATQDIRLDAMVALLEVKPDIAMVRARGIAGTPIIAHLFEADVSDYLPDYQDGVGLPGRLAYWQLDRGSSTPYLYSNGPHLKHKRFHEFYGNYPEGLKLGATEESYAHTVKDKMFSQPDGVGVPAIVILPQDVVMYFDHQGHSYQLTEADKGAE